MESIIITAIAWRAWAWYCDKQRRICAGFAFRIRIVIINSSYLYRYQFPRHLPLRAYADAPADLHCLYTPTIISYISIWLLLSLFNIVLFSCCGYSFRPIPRLLRSPARASIFLIHLHPFLIPILHFFSPPMPFTFPTHPFKFTFYSG